MDLVGNTISLSHIYAVEIVNSATVVVYDMPGLESVKNIGTGIFVKPDTTTVKRQCKIYSTENIGPNKATKHSLIGYDYEISDGESNIMFGHGVLF